MEVEDDLLFADLNKQISLLIMDDNDEHPVVHTPVSLRVFSHPPIGYYYPYENATKRSSVSKGTGVFIPVQSLYQTKKSNHGNLKSSHGVRLQPDTSKVSSNHSFKSRKG